MKIFGIEFGKDKVSKELTTPVVDVVDAFPIEGTLPTKKIGKIGSVDSPAMIYQQNGGSVVRPDQKRNVFEPTEYDLYEIGRIEDNEAYVRQAFKKQVGLFLKEGFDYVGSNKKTVKYIKTRFAQIERATGIPHEEFIRRLVSQFVRKSNVIVARVRDEAASGGQTYRDLDGITRKPVAGYFPMPPEMMEVKVYGNGKPFVWRQRMPHGLHFDYDASDIIHMTFDRKEGFLFGTPLIQPVIDDIRALRKIEENIEMLIYKHLFPMFQYVVGTEGSPAGVMEDGQREIDVARYELQNMPSEGGIVTSERYEIRSVGSESKALRAEGYLSHFKTRVFSGLGMSAVDFGEPDTSNRSTADNMSRALIDNIKDLQESFEAQFNKFIINELLEESTFEDDVLAPENIVRLEFREVDIDKQVKIENQAADMFNKNAITWDEMRRDIGRDPIAIPDDPETTDRTQYPEWFNTHWKLFQEPEKLINAGDESYSSLALGKSVSTDVTPGDVTQGQQQQQQNEIQLVKAKAAAKPKPRKDSFLNGGYSYLEGMIKEEVGKNKPVDMNYLRSKIQMISDQMASTLRTQMNTAFIREFGSSTDPTSIARIQSARNEIHDRSALLIRRLTHDILTSVSRQVDTQSQDVKLSTVSAIFDSFKYRIDFMTQHEVERATNLGKIIRVVELGGVKGKYLVQEETCGRCHDHAKEDVYLHGYNINTVPPHHPNCQCGLQITQVKDQ